MTIKERIEIIIADDHPLIRLSYRAMISNSPDLKIVAEAADGYELIGLTRMVKPAIIITDILMPGIDGIEATRIITKEFPYIGIIAVSIVEKENLVVNMLEAGAKGYLLKTDPVNDVLLAIRTVFKGESYFSRDISNSTIKNGAGQIEKPILSIKEKAIIKLICQQYTNKQIADQLSLSKRTIDWYRHQILQKLDVKNTAGIVSYGLANL